MNGEGGKVESINGAMRAVCLILLVVPFAFAFTWGVFTAKMFITTGEYIGVLTLAITWFFKSRDEKAQKESGGKAQVTTPSGTTTTGATTKVDMPSASEEPRS